MRLHDDLIFDVGLHKGEDTTFYLAKGFRVVAVDANPDLCADARDTFASAISRGQLTVVHAAIAPTEGPVTFYANSHSEFGTINPAWVARNASQLNAPPVREFTVPGVSFGSLLETYGVPYYLKIDIEGSDLLCLEALTSVPAKPRFVSIESEKRSWRRLTDEFRLLETLGYSRFKVVNQRNVPTQVPPNPAREGSYVDHRFPESGSGLFGEEAPGPWLTRRRALLRYIGIFARYRVYGDYGLVRRSSRPGRILAALLSRAFGHPAWYDTHATR